MSRRQVFKVEDYPPCTAGVEYLGRVAQIRKEPRADHLRVQIELLDKEQKGRHIEFLLGLPIRPSGPTNSFFQASGLAVSVGAEIDPQEAVDRMVRVTLETSVGGELQATRFRSAYDSSAAAGATSASPDQPNLFPEGQQ